MKMHFVWIFLCEVAAGCAPAPFVADPLPPLQNPNPATLRDTFLRAMPRQFVSEDSIIIQAPFHHDMAALGVMRVDRTAGTFELVVMNQTGLKLLAMSGNRSGVVVNFAIGPLMQHKDLLQLVGRDVGRIFLDEVPSSAQGARIGSNSVQFRDKQSDGTVYYEFGGDPPVLLEKWADGFFGSIWRVRYYHYAPHPGGLYPRGIVMDNAQLHYRIIVKNRDVEIDQ